MVDGNDLPLGAPLAEAPGHQDSVVLVEDLDLLNVFLEGLGLDPVDLDPAPSLRGGVAEGLVDAHVAVRELRILAAHRDLHRLRGLLESPDHILPCGPVRGAVPVSQVSADHVAHLLLLQDQGQLVEGLDIHRGEDGFLLDATVEGDLPLGLPRKGLPLFPDYDDFGLETDGPELLDAVLGWLSLGLPHRLEGGDEGDVNQQGVAPGLLEPHLPEGLEEGEALDVPDGAPALHEEEVDLGLPGDEAEALLDLVGDVGNDLDAAPQVATLPLLPDDVLVDLARGDVVEARELDTEEALVGPEVHVGLVAVVEDEDLAVDVRVHGARVDVEVGITFDGTDVVSSNLEHLPDGAGHQPLPEAAQHAPRNKNIFHQEEYLPTTTLPLRLETYKSFDAKKGKK